MIGKKCSKKEENFRVALQKQLESVFLRWKPGRVGQRDGFLTVWPAATQLIELLSEPDAKHLTILQGRGTYRFTETEKGSRWEYVEDDDSSEWDGAS